MHFSCFITNRHEKGVIKRCHLYFIPWIIAQTIFMTFLFVLLVSSLISDDLFDKYVRDFISAYPDRCKIFQVNDFSQHNPKIHMVLSP